MTPEEVHEFYKDPAHLVPAGPGRRPRRPALKRREDEVDNPRDWGKAEKIIDEVMSRVLREAEGILEGKPLSSSDSMQKQIADAQREAGILHDSEDVGLRPAGVEDEDAARRLAHRVAVLLKLYELKAPQLIIDSQMRLVLQAAAWLLQGNGKVLTSKNLQLLHDANEEEVQNFLNGARK